MNDKYLHYFKEQFFDVEENKEIKTIIEQASSALAFIINKFGEVQNKFACEDTMHDGYTDIVVSMFVRKIIEGLDAINVLFAICSFDQAQIILRTLIENIVSLEFILKEDTEKRAAAYFLEHHYQEIELGKKIFGNNSNYKKAIVETCGENEYDNAYESFKRKQEAYEHLIKSNDLFCRIDEARKKKIEEKRKAYKENRKNKKGKKSKHRVYVQWYEVCSDVSSVYGLMSETGYGKYYSGIYGGFSFETHALNSTMAIKKSEKGLDLTQIRNPVGGSNIFSVACDFSIGVLIKIYEYFNDGAEEKRKFKVAFVEFQQKRDYINYQLDQIKEV